MLELEALNNREGELFLKFFRNYWRKSERQWRINELKNCSAKKKTESKSSLKSWKLFFIKLSFLVTDQERKTNFLYSNQMVKAFISITKSSLNHLKQIGTA